MSAELQTRPLFDILTERNIANIFWVDKYISGTIGVDAVFESKRINEEDLPNFANYDTTAQNNVSHDLNGYELQFINGKAFRYAQAVAPTIGEAEFEILGYGNTNSDIIYKISNGLFVDILNIKGDGNFTHKGERNFNSKNGSNDSFTKLNAFGTFGVNYLQFYRNNGANYQGQIYVSDDRLNFSHSFGIDFNIFNGGVKIGTGGLNSSALFQLTSTTKGFILEPMTSSQASAITPAEGLELNVSDTNATFTSIGKWQYIGGSWVKL